MLVNFGDISLQAISRGTGELVVLLPFLGRSVRDFDALSAQLLEAGFRVLAINPRGVGESSGPRKEMTLEDHVSDVIRVIEAAGGGQAHVVGYGFGGHVARRLLESHPERVLSIVLIGAGGTTRTKTPVLMQQIRRAAFRRFGLMASNMRNTALPLQKQQGNALRGILKRAYFGADATVPAAWFDGWYPEAGLAQHVLLETSGPGGWWQRSTAPILVIQGAEDRLTDPRNGQQLREQLGERVQLVEVTGAGHAVLTEQPEQTGAAIRSFLQMHRTVAMGADARGAATSAEQAGSSSDRGSTMGRMSGSFQYQPVETVGGLQVIKVTNDSMRRFSKEPGHYDVAIVGTGLTGSVLATLLARQGAKVLMIDSGIHPRYSIGESVPMVAARMLELMSKRFAVPELENLASFPALRRHVSSNCGIKKNFGFVYHREGQAPDRLEGNQMVAPPFISEYHLFRQDTDQYMFAIAVRYGADFRVRTPISEVRPQEDRITLVTRGGEQLHARYVVDTSGPQSALAAHFKLREQPTRIKYQSRALYTHMVNVKPFDDVVPPPGAYGNPSPWHEGTLHHLFDGGSVWVIPFDNHPSSTNPLCSVGLSLDPRRFPKTNMTAEDEFRSIIARFPGIAAQFKDASQVREWVSTDRRQYSSSRCVGDRFCLIDEAAGFVDDPFSRGLADATELVNALAVRLPSALADDDLTAQRFNYIEQLQQRVLNRNDQLMCGIATASRDYALWNAWFKACMVGVGLGEVRMTNLYLKYLEDRDPSVFAELDTSSEPASFLPGFDRYREFWDQVLATMAAAEEGGLSSGEAATRIHGLLQEADKADFSPPGAHIGDPSVRHFDLNPFYLLKALGWAAFAPARSELMELHRQTVKRLAKGVLSGKAINAMS